MTQSLELPGVLEPLRSMLEKLVLPCVLLVETESPSGLTHIAGSPRMAAGSTWPSGPDGPLTFVGQLDFAQIAAAGGAELGIPVRGLLALFCDSSFWSGETNEDRARVHLAYVEDAACSIELTPPDDVEVAPAEPLLAKRGLSLPDIADPLLSSYESLHDRQRRDAYIDLREALNTQQRGAHVSDDDHRLRGHASTDDRPPGMAAWKLLWQVDTLSLPGWNEVGSFEVLMRDEDLTLCAFDRAWVLHRIV